MRLFGKRQKNGDKKPKDKKKKQNKRKYKRPSDVKLFYQMPVLLTASVLCLLVGGFWMGHNKAEYQKQVMASSMSYKEELPLWGGTSKGTLSLGHTRLSKDGKTLAVEIVYDAEAHKQLSSFGNRYKLRLIDTHNNRMNDAKISYGIFGTDGSGVLKIYNPKGFQNESFIVMLIDNGQLVSSDDLTSQTEMSDTELDKSITAELSSSSDDSDSNNSNDASQDSKKAKLPPLYYVRLNALNAKRNNRNWADDSEMIEDLFIKSNLSDIKKQMTLSEKKLAKAKKTLKEMNRRLNENPNDSVASSNKNEIEDSIKTLDSNYKALKDKYKKLNDSSIQDDILKPKQTKYHEYTVDSIDNIN